MPEGEPLDILVVGGGVNGCGVARDAAGRGWRTLLVEAHDLASGTSSKSSKLIHGGLRYLEYYEFRLVRESLQEREVLLACAPHLVRPLRFVLPHHKGLRPASMLRLGLFLYDHIGGRRKLPATRTLDLTRDPAGAPLQARYRKGFEYSDCWVDDARLVALLAVDAAERGARVLTRTRLVSARREGGVWLADIQHADGRGETIRTRSLVNAAGAWVDKVLRTTGRTAPPGDAVGEHAVRLVKGSHIVLPRLYDGPQCYTLQNADGRVVFAIPYEAGPDGAGRTLVGTTDIPFDGDPADVRMDAEEAEYLCGVIGDYFAKTVAPADIVWSYSGVRPLADSGEANASAVTRDYVFDLEGGAGRPEGAPRLSVYGGKLTTFRKLAEHALHDLGEALGDRRPAWTASATLPGGEIVGGFEAFRAEAAALWPWLPEATLTRMAHAYGGRLARVLGDAAAWVDLGRDFGGGLTEREAEHLRREEWAATAEDVLWRRSKLGLRLTRPEQEAFRSWFEQGARQPSRAAAG